MERRYIIDNLLKVLIILIILPIIVFYFLTRSRVDYVTKELYKKVEAIYQEGVKIKVEIEEEVPITLTIPIKDVVDIEKIIPEEIPYSADVPIKTTVRIDQEVSVPIEIPLLGRYVVNVPLDLDVPIDQKVSFSSTIKIDPSLFNITDEVIYINQNIPISVPIEVEIIPRDLNLEEETRDILTIINNIRYIFFLNKIL
jgi:hypothetical protein